MIECIFGDCIEKMKGITDESIDMVLCDLPYGVLNRGNKDAKWDNIIPMDLLWKEYERIIKPNGAIILFGQGMFTAKLMLSNEKLWKYNLIWKKDRSTGFLNAKRCPLRAHEDILVFYKKQPTYNPQFTIGKPIHGKGNGKHKNGNRCYGDFDQSYQSEITDKKYPISVLEFPKEHKDFFHPNQKPVALLEWLIKTYSNEGDLILDNCAGSMSTGVAAFNTKRNCICIEKDENFFSVGKNRIEELTNG